MSQITEFYVNGGPDNLGRTLHDYLNFSYEDRERVHDYIQWMFPLNEESEYNDSAPILTRDDIQTILREKGQEPILISFHYFFDFLLENRHLVYGTPNHNWKRISRVIKCLRLFGLATIAYRFWNTSMLLLKDPRSETVFYWNEALHKPLWKD